MSTFDLLKDGSAVQTGVDSPIKITGLKPNTTYDNYSVAYTGETNSTPLSFTTSDTVPGAPTVQVTADDAQLFVKIIPGTNNGSDISDGKVYYTDGTNAKTMELKPNVAGTISGLTNGTEYTIQAIVTNAAGDSAKSEAVTATPKTADTSGQ